MVKPALPYLDVIQDCAQLQPDLPTACYQVSGEFAMIHAGARAGVYDLRQMAEETVGGMMRAGEWLPNEFFVLSRQLAHATCFSVSRRVDHPHLFHARLFGLARPGAFATLAHKQRKNRIDHVGIEAYGGAAYIANACRFLEHCS